MLKITRLFFLIFEFITLAKLSVGQSNVLNENGILNEGGQLISLNGQFRATLQSDGNFVIYVTF
jgi:hypothetical protein